MVSAIIKNTIELRQFYKAFMRNESIGGVLLLICAVIAILFVNVIDPHGWHEFWMTPAGISIGSFELEMSLEQWINDGLMAIFFFVVGLEIKREMLVGELASFKHAALPIFAAVGGMIVPAVLYSIFNHSNPETISGWGIPMATDIAFALGILSLLGNRVPMSLKIFLTALAIVDDLGAIIVLAIFYPTHALHFDMLFYALIIAAFLFTLGRFKVRYPLLYMIPGLFLWYFIYESGIHATIAGVILALTIPAKTNINEVRFHVSIKYWIKKFVNVSNGEVEVLANPAQQHIIHQISENVRKINPLMHRFESALHPWTTFFVMPIFALANSGVEFTGDLFQVPLPTVGVGIFFGLLFGKPIGIFLFSFISVKLKIAELPIGAKWVQILALGVLAGIGFTMSIFIDGLAFTDDAYVNIGKAAILLTSSCAAILGLVAMILTNKKSN
ncbi:MAG: Na+/H+ antiporter NhaA [Bacteroidales bacterium]|nr:Na+/H+ antiporter NhaA [Bacteroidales bacterium]